MVQAPTGTAKDTSGDVLDNLGPFARDLRAQNRSEATIESYSTAVRQFDDFLAEQGMPRLVANIHREHVAAFIEGVLRRAKPATAANRYRSLQQFFRYLRDEGEITASPMERMKPPHVPEPLIPVLSEDEVKALLKATEGTTFDERRDRAIISLMLDTGIRRAEVAGLRLEDLDRDHSVVFVVGKGSRPRSVPYDRKPARELDRYIDRARKHHPHADEPWLWLGKKGRLTDSGITQVIRRRGIEAGIPALHPHQFRHTFAHQWLADGGQEGDLMQIAGWKERSMPHRYGRSAAVPRAHKAFRELRDRTR
jgi:site-specific recombinase XerD